jgi:hypothetical protein
MLLVRSVAVPLCDAAGVPTAVAFVSLAELRLSVPLRAQPANVTSATREAAVNKTCFIFNLLVFMPRMVFRRYSASVSPSARSSAPCQFLPSRAFLNPVKARLSISLVLRPHGSERRAGEDQDQPDSRSGSAPNNRREEETIFVNISI